MISLQVEKIKLLSSSYCQTLMVPSKEEVANSGFQGDVNGLNSRGRSSRPVIGASCAPLLKRFFAGIHKVPVSAEAATKMALFPGRHAHLTKVHWSLRLGSEVHLCSIPSSGEVRQQ